MHALYLFTERSHVQKLTTEHPKLNKMKVKASVISATNAENKELATHAVECLTEYVEALYTCVCARSHARTSFGGGVACLYMDACILMFVCVCVCMEHVRAHVRHS